MSLFDQLLFLCLFLKVSFLPGKESHQCSQLNARSSTQQILMIKQHWYHGSETIFREYWVKEHISRFALMPHSAQREEAVFHDAGVGVDLQIPEFRCAVMYKGRTLLGQACEKAKIYLHTNLWRHWSSCLEELWTCEFECNAHAMLISGWTTMVLWPVV